jgi:chromosome partitioning protein
MIIVIGSQKGGCGKSTTTASICAALASQGKDIVLVDADRQATAANWAADRDQDDTLAPVYCVQKYDNIRSTLIDLDKRYEYVVVDAAGRDSRELRTSITAAHMLIVPFRPSQPDLDTLPHMQEVITQAQDLNSELKVYGLLTMNPTNPSVNEEAEAREYFQEFPIIHPLKTMIYDRKVYRDSMSVGKGVTEMSNPKAKTEIENLLREIL